MGAHRGNAWRLPLFFLVFLSGAVCAEQTVDVDRDGKVFRIHVETPVAADVHTAWQVLTDYDHLADFVPDMQESHALRIPGQPLRLEQKGEGRALLFSTAIDIVFEIEETPPEQIAFRAVAGNMKQMNGKWRIVPLQQEINLVYEAELEPDFWVPPLIGKALVRRNALRQIGGVVAEILKRQAAMNDARQPK